MVSDGKTVWYYADNCAYRLDLKTGADMSASFGAYGKVVSIDRDREGCFYIADAACAQIIKCNEEGQEYLRIGKPGGRARQGKYDPLGFVEISDMAVDGTGRIWVTEKGSKPRRLSVWNPDGSFCREYIGNAGYAGQGTFLHSQNPDKACAELNEMVYDRSADRWRVENVMYNPDPAGGASITPGYSDFDSGNMFYSDASGEVKEYFAVLGMPRTASFFLMVKEQDLWKPVSAVCTVADLQHLLGGQYNARIVRDSYGEWADNDPADVLFWNDYNNDGYVTKDECVIIPSPCCTFTGAEPYISLEEVMPFYACCCSSLTPADLSFLGTLREQGHEPMACLVKPVRFRDGGKPVYLPEGICPITDQFALWGSAAQLPAKNLVIAFIRQNDQVWVAGFRRDTGEILWKHKSPYHQVHGSHNAPMPKPGMLIGCLKIAGIAEGCGDSDVFMVRGNLGEDYFLTTDGMYINTLTRDSRLPGVAFPEDAESLRKVSFSRFTGRCEHFSGVFVRQTDGIIRCSGGLPASQAGNIIRVEGLDTIRHIGQSQIRITADRIREAMQANQERMLAARTPLEPIRIVPAGEGWDLAPA
ncbi:MAG: hypothetical protein IJX14_03775, partial [Clostridia bacterium]|nr:hypothetical protein [Clostridia bacterium]